MSIALRIVKAGLSPAIVGMVSKVYIPVLFPLTFLIAMVALGLDRLLGLDEGFLSRPTNLWLALGSFALGTVLWLWTYEQLSTRGEGSPSPTAGRTQKLVINGIYRYSRNPSLFGKTLGVLAVGFALNSASFCFVLVPLLLAGSLVEKVVRQEPQLVEIFGEDYERYRDETPLFLPWTLFLPKRSKGST